MGKLLVISGGDGSGKTLQSKKLCQRIKEERKSDVSLFDFPQYDGFFGKLIRRSLDKEFGNFSIFSPYYAALPYAIDRLTVKEKLRGVLERGDCVSNRYTPDNLAHQAAKLLVHERAGFVSWLEELEYRIFGLPQPDLVIYLKVSPEISRRLMGNRVLDDHEADYRYQEAVAEVFEQLALEKATEGWRLIDCVEAGNILPPQRIHDLIWQQAEKIL